MRIPVRGGQAPSFAPDKQADHSEPARVHGAPARVEARPPPHPSRPRSHGRGEIERAQT